MDALGFEQGQQFLGRDLFAGSSSDSSSTGFLTISWVIISFNSSRLSWRTVTIWTRPGVRICFCATFNCSLGDSKLIWLL